VSGGRNLRKLKNQNSLYERGGEPPGVGQCTAEVLTSFKVGKSGTPWYDSMRLDELNLTILGRPAFDHFERSYSSSAHWVVP